MRRGRARVQLELPSSPPFPTNSPPCDFHSIPSTPIFLCLDALEIVPNLGPRASFLPPPPPSWFIQRCNGKNKGGGERVGSRSDREPNRLSPFLSPLSSRRNFCLHDTLFTRLASVKFINGGKMEIFGPNRSVVHAGDIVPNVGLLFTRFLALGELVGARVIFIAAAYYKQTISLRYLIKYRVISRTRLSLWFSHNFRWICFASNTLEEF